MDQPTVVRPKIWLAVLNALFAAAGLGLGAWCALSIPEAAYGGMRAPAYLILWILVWFGCNRGFALWQQFAATGLPRTTLRVAKWVLPFLLPIPLIRAVESTVQARQLDIARHALAPVIAYADKMPRRHALQHRCTFRIRHRATRFGCSPRRSTSTVSR